MIDDDNGCIISQFLVEGKVGLILSLILTFFGLQVDFVVFN